MLLRSLILREASLFATLNSLGLMIETHRISNFVRDIVHTRRAVALGRASAEDADKVYVAYLDSVMVRSTAQSPSSRKAQVSKLRQIMLLAEEQPAPSARAVGVGREDAPELSRETHVKSLFAAMVDSGARGGARASSQHGRFACADVV